MEMRGRMQVRRRNPRAVAAYLWKYYVPFFLWFPVAYYAYGTVGMVRVLLDNQKGVNAYYDWRMNRLEYFGSVEHIPLEDYAIIRQRIKDEHPEKID